MKVVRRYVLAKEKNCEHRSRGAGFTLIEILVVIAIIAIVAAILLPVFASARVAARNSAALSNTKQTGVAIILYLADNDETYPSATSIDNGSGASVATGHTTASISGQPLASGGTVSVNDKWFTGIPAGANSASLTAIDQVAWVNSTNSYRKSYDLTQLPALPIAAAFPTSVMNGFVQPPATSSLTMNGLLSTLQAGAVASPTQCPIVWPGQGKWNFRGGSLVSPYLACDNTTTNPAPPCRFNASGPPQTGGNLALTTSGDSFGDGIWIYKTGWWLYGRGFNYASADSSAHFAGVADGATHGEPFGHVDQNGYPTTAGNLRDASRCTTMTGSLTYSYLSWFRPDSLYSYPTGNQSATEIIHCGW